MCGTIPTGSVDAVGTDASQILDNGGVEGEAPGLDDAPAGDAADHHRVRDPACPLVLEAPLRNVNRICGFLLERDSLVTRVPAGIIHCRRLLRVAGSYAEWRTRRREMVDGVGAPRAGMEFFRGELRPGVVKVTGSRAHVSSGPRGLAFQV